MPFNPRHTALPDEEVRWLVTRIVARGGVEPFVRRMVALIEDLKAGTGGGWRVWLRIAETRS